MKELMTERTESASRTSGELRVCVASLAECLRGRLKTRWIVATSSYERMCEDAEAVDDDIKGQSEGCLIQHHAGFGKLRIEPRESLLTLSEFAGGVEEHGDWFVPFVDAVQDCLDSRQLPENVTAQACVTTARDWAINRFLGIAASPGEWAERWYTYEHDSDKIDALPERIRKRIDWPAIALDMQLAEEFLFVQFTGGTAVFSLPKNEHRYRRDECEIVTVKIDKDKGDVCF